MANSHSDRTVSSVNWNLLRVIIQTGLGLMVSILLARILPPEDFGLLATAMIFLGLAELVGSMGMGSAVIQRANVTKDDIATAGTLSVITGLVLALAVAAIAPWLADLFKEPEVTRVVQAMALGLFISAIAAVPKGMIMRRMDFKCLFFIDLIAYMSGYAGLAIVLALNDFGVWSLVWGALLSMALTSGMVIFSEPLRIKWRLKWTEAKSLLRFGGGMSLNSLINYCAANVDYFSIGKFLDQHALGLYSRAYHLVTLPLNKVATTLTSVMFPAYSEIQADPTRVKTIYLRIVEVIGLVIFPVMIAFAVAGEYVIVGLYGPNWYPAVDAFRILALAGMLKVIFHLAGPVVQASGYVYHEVARQAVYLLVLAVGCVLVAHKGIEAVAWVVVTGSAWLYLSMAQLVLRIVGGQWSQFIKAQLPGLVLAGFVALANVAAMTFIANLGLPPEIGLLVIVLVCGVVYLLGFLYIPAVFIGTSPAWLISKYASKMPTYVGLYLQTRRPMIDLVQK